MPIEPDFVQLTRSFQNGIFPSQPDTIQRIADGAAANAWVSILSIEHDNEGVLYVIVEGELLIGRGGKTSAPAGDPAFLASNGIPLLIAKRKGETWWYQGASGTANRVRGGVAGFYGTS